jgi:hypothetical protein
MDIRGSFPMHGDIEWIASDAGGRKSPPAGPTFATTAWRETIGPQKGTASFVLRGFAPTWERSPADGRWLFNQTDAALKVTAPEVVIVAEGAKPVARFHIYAVDSQQEIWARIEGWLREALRSVQLAQPDNDGAVEYLNHNELGLAFEVVVQALVERGRPVTAHELRLLWDAAADMNLSGDATWKRLREISSG